MLVLNGSREEKERVAVKLSSLQRLENIFLSVRPSS